MDTRQRRPPEGLGRLITADWRITLAVGALVLGGVYFVATSMAAGTNAPLASATLPPAPTLALTPTTGAASTPALTPAAAATVAATATAAGGTPVATATPTEAQTPLTLSDPLATNTTSAAAAPWWQGGLDVLWKLGLVLAVIYLAMRGLALFQERGFRPRVSAADPERPRFFEKLEEIRLTATYSLFAVRAGDRILLLAQNGTTITQIGEVELAEEVVEAAPAPPPPAEPSTLPALPAIPATPFGRQMMRAWGGLLPAMSGRDAAPPATDPAIEAQWVTVEAEAASPPAAKTPVTKRGATRPSDKPAPPEPLDSAGERAILWYAEEHGISAAAAKYGLSRQRVTALRARYERDRANRPPRAEPDVVAAPAKVESATRPKPATAPAAPQGSAPATPPTSLVAARAALARASYAGADVAAPVAPKATTRAPRRPDVALPADSAADDVAAQAANVAQALATRFGIALKP